VVPGRALACAAQCDTFIVRAPLPGTGPTLLPSNFGLLHESDGGWRLGCDNLVGAEWHLGRVVGSRERRALLVPAANGLSRSTTLGCEWQPVGGDVEGHTVRQIVAAEDVWVLAADSKSIAQSVQRSIDGGSSFQKMAAFPHHVVQGLYHTEFSLLAAHPDGTVLLAGAALYPYRFVVHRSADAGQHWDELEPELGRFSGDDRVTWLGIASDNPELVFAQRSHEQDRTDSLWVSADAAQSFHPALELRPGWRISATLVAEESGALYAAALSPTPGDSNALYVSKDAGDSFRRISASVPAVYCLSEHAGLIYGCTVESSTGFSVGHSADDGATWNAAFRVSDLVGARACTDDTNGVAAAQCAAAATLICGGLTELCPVAMVDDVERTPGSGGQSPGGCSLGHARQPVWAGFVLFGVAWVRRLARKRLQRPGRWTLGAFCGAMTACAAESSDDGSANAVISIGVITFGGFKPLNDGDAVQVIDGPQGGTWVHVALHAENIEATGQVTASVEPRIGLIRHWVEFERQGASHWELRELTVPVERRDAYPKPATLSVEFEGPARGVTADVHVRLLPP
jgi:hypothetical protein